MAVLLVDLGVGPCVLHRHVLRLAAVPWVAARHDFHVLSVSWVRGVKPDSRLLHFEIGVIEVFLVDIARLGLLEGPWGSLRVVPDALARLQGRTVGLSGRVSVSDSVVHLLEATEHGFVGRMRWVA